MSEPLLVVYRSGVCRVCGCTDATPCLIDDRPACWWVDQLRTLCSNPQCIAVVPYSELARELRHHQVTD